MGGGGMETKGMLFVDGAEQYLGSGVSGMI